MPITNYACLTEAAPWQDGSNLTGFSIERCYKSFFQMCGPVQFAAFSFQRQLPAIANKWRSTIAFRATTTMNYEHTIKLLRYEGAKGMNSLNVTWQKYPWSKVPETCKVHRHFQDQQITPELYLTRREAQLGKPNPAEQFCQWRAWDQIRVFQSISHTFNSQNFL